MLLPRSLSLPPLAGIRFLRVNNHGAAALLDLLAVVAFVAAGYSVMFSLPPLAGIRFLTREQPRCCGGLRCCGAA